MTCKVCGAKTSGMFLCRDHVAELRDMLGGLARGQRHRNGQRSPGWLDLLVDASVGRTRLGDGGSRRGPRRDTHLDGEASLASHIEVFPKDDEPDLARARRQRERLALDHALAAGGVNGRASALLGRVRKLLDGWCVVAGEVTGVAWVSLDVSDLGASALWLARSVPVLAAKHPDVGVLYTDVRKAVEDVEHAINRPVPPRPCGPCPTIVGAHGKQCGQALAARRDEVEIKCPLCRETYNVEQLLIRLTNQTHYMLFTVSDLLWLLPLGEENVPRRTLYDWIAKKRLLPRGEDASGAPTYLMADVRRLRAEKPKRKVKAG